MYRGLTVLLLGVSLCAGAVVPQTEADGFAKEQTKQQGPPNTQLANQQPAYNSLQSSHVPANQYYYPTYPEYAGTGYAAPSGYEGYLIPTGISPQRNANWVTEIAENIFPFSSQLLIYGARLGVYFLQFLSTVIIGGAFTTLVCTLTPLCTISFQAFGITNNQVKEQVAELARTYITPESVNAATVLVTRAIDKYAEMQRERTEAERTVRRKRAAGRMRR